MYISPANVSRSQIETVYRKLLIIIAMPIVTDTATINEETATAVRLRDRYNSRAAIPGINPMYFFKIFDRIGRIKYKPSAAKMEKPITTRRVAPNAHHRF